MATDRTVEIPLDRIDDNPYQTRRDYDEEHIADLAASIERTRLMQPPSGRIVDRSTGEPIPTEWKTNFGRVQLAFGHNRVRAFRKLGRETIPVQLLDLGDEEMADQAWDENFRRNELNPVEEALAAQDRLDAFGYTKKELAERMGIGRSTLSNKLRLLKLPEEILDYVKAGALSERKATALVPLYTLEADEQRIMDAWHTQHHYRPEHVLQNALDGYTSGEVRSVVASAKERIENTLREEAEAPSREELEERVEELRTRHRQADPPYPSDGTVYDAETADLREAEERYWDIARDARHLFEELSGHAELKEETLKLRGRAQNTAETFRQKVEARHKKEREERLSNSGKEEETTMHASSGDGAASSSKAAEDVPADAFAWPRPQLPAEWRMIGEKTKDGLYEMHRRFAHEQWKRYAQRFMKGANKPEQLEHVQSQLRFHANLEAVQLLDDEQTRELGEWMEEKADDTFGFSDTPVGWAKKVLRSIKDAEELGAMREDALGRLRLAETRRAGAFCYHLFYEDRADLKPAVRPSAAGDGQATGQTPTLRDPDTADMFDPAPAAAS